MQKVGLPKSSFFRSKSFTMTQCGNCGSREIYEKSGKHWYTREGAVK